jgi:hypothetical protein
VARSVSWCCIRPHASLAELSSSPKLPKVESSLSATDHARAAGMTTKGNDRGSASWVAATDMALATNVLGASGGPATAVAVEGNDRGSSSWVAATDMALATNVLGASGGPATAVAVEGNDRGGSSWFAAESEPGTAEALACNNGGASGWFADLRAAAASEGSTREGLAVLCSQNARACAAVGASAHGH